MVRLYTWHFMWNYMNAIGLKNPCSEEPLKTRRGIEGGRSPRNVHHLGGSIGWRARCFPAIVTAVLIIVVQFTVAPTCLLAASGDPAECDCWAAELSPYCAVVCGGLECMGNCCEEFCIFDPYCSVISWDCYMRQFGHTPAPCPCGGHPPYPP